MSFIFTVEAIRFHKLRNQLLVQIMFLVLLIAHGLFSIFPPGNPDFAPMLQGLYRALEGRTTDINIFRYFDTSHYIFFGATLLLGLFNLIVSLAYAGALTSELDGFPAMKGVRDMLKKLPQILLWLVLLVVPFILSTLFMMIPFVILICFLAFTPLFLANKQLKLGQAMSESARMTRGVKFPMFLSFLLLSVIFSLPRSLLLAIVPKHPISQGLISAFFTALQVLMRGRLLALYFTFFVNRFPMGAADYYRPGDPRTMFAEIGRTPEDESEQEDDARDTRLPGDHHIPDDDAPEDTEDPFGPSDDD